MLALSFDAPLRYHSLSPVERKRVPQLRRVHEGADWAALHPLDAG